MNFDRNSTIGEELRAALIEAAKREGDSFSWLSSKSGNGVTVSFEGDVYVISTSVQGTYFEDEIIKYMTDNFGEMKNSFVKQSEISPGLEISCLLWSSDDVFIE